MTARFIVFEGGEGVGKSTQAERLAARLGAVRTREPGGTAFGARVREVFLDPATGDLDPRAEALLMAADRAQHVAEVVRPALAAGRHVVSDRYFYSSVAYQARARGLEPVDVSAMSMWATGGLRPDAVVLLDLPYDVARGRLGSTPDRMEAEDASFHERVSKGFWEQAEADPGRWIVLDATPAPDEIARQVWSALVARLPDLLDE